MRSVLFLLLAASTATAGPLPASYQQVPKSKTEWVSAAMSLADADRAWHEVANKPGFVALIVDESPDAEASTATRPLSLAAARASLEKRRKDEHDAILRVLTEHPEIPVDEAAAARVEWTAWTSQLRTATITAEDRKDAADLVAADAQERTDFEGKPKQYFVLVIAGSVDAVLATFDGYNGSPGGAELAPFLAKWRKAYGARPYAWDGYQLTLDVARPPRRLAELRKLAAAFALTCPYDRSGAGTVGLHEPPSHLMARLEQKRWVCYWFEE